MSVQDAFELLTATSRMPDTWNRRQEEHSFDQSNPSFSKGFNPGQQITFPPVSVYYKCTHLDTTYFNF